MTVDWKRILRTTIQSGSGAVIGLITAVTNNFEKTAIITAIITCISTVAISFFMNLQKQAEEQIKEHEDK